MESWSDGLRLTNYDQLYKWPGEKRFAVQECDATEVEDCLNVGNINILGNNKKRLSIQLAKSSKRKKI